MEKKPAKKRSPVRKKADQALKAASRTLSPDKSSKHQGGRAKKLSRKDLDFFKSVNLLENLNTDQVSKVYSISKRKVFNKGTTIMREGDDGDSMYLFYEGKVEVLNTLTMKFGKNDFEETEKSMVKLDASFVSFFGEMSLLEDAPRSATITAQSDCVLYELHKADFKELCRKEPVIGYFIVSKIAEVLCARIRKSNKDILKLTTALSIALSR